MPRVHTVFFDALYTLVTPRLTIAEVYTRIINSHAGPVPLLAVEKSFPQALGQLERERPAYDGGKTAWWSEVVKRTAVGAGANPQAVEVHLPQMVEHLMEVFRSKEGYALYPDVLGTLSDLKRLGVRIGVVSNADSRIRDVLHDLAVLPYLSVIILSEEEGLEKPSPYLWQRACDRAGVTLSRSVLHIGDELDADFYGATHAGLASALLRRPGVPVKGRDWKLPTEGQSFNDGVVVETLASVVDLVR